MRRSALLAIPTALVLLPAAPLSAQSFDELSRQVRSYVSVHAPVVALSQVLVVDGTGAPPAEDQTVVIDHGRIAAVGPATEVNVPAGAQVLELRGHTVIPGIIGMHNHTYYSAGARETEVPYSAPRLYLGSGVTTIRTIGSISPYTELNLERSIDAGETPGPEMFISGPYLTGSGTSLGRYHLSDAADPRRVVDYWAEEGVRWFKAYTRITRAELGALIDAAHERVLKVTGHLCSVSFHEAVRLGIDNLEHGLLANSDYSPDKAPDVCPSGSRSSLLAVDVSGNRVQATIRELVDGGVAITSTLAVWETLVPDRPPPDDRSLAAMLPQVREEVLTVRRQLDQEGEDSPMPELFEKEMRFERAFVRAGGLLVAGCDPTGYGAAVPGFGDQRNIELLVEAGFTPVEAIQIATSNGAKLLAEADRIGTVAVGKEADLVVIRGNPADNISDIRNVTTVFKDGVGYDSEKLIRSVDGQLGLH